jgi:6-phosphofructokinase 1
VVDICLIPEVPFELPKLLEHVDKILAAKGHCVVCVAEGAGQNLAQVGSQHWHIWSHNPVVTQRDQGLPGLVCS